MRFFMIFIIVLLVSNAYGKESVKVKGEGKGKISIDGVINLESLLPAELLEEVNKSVRLLKGSRKKMKELLDKINELQERESPSDEFRKALDDLKNKLIEQSKRVEVAFTNLVEVNNNQDKLSSRVEKLEKDNIVNDVKENLLQVSSKLDNVPIINIELLGIATADYSLTNNEVSNFITGGAGLWIRKNLLNFRAGLTAGVNTVNSSFSFGFNSSVEMTLSRFSAGLYCAVSQDLGDMKKGADKITVSAGFIGRYYLLKDLSIFGTLGAGTYGKKGEEWKDPNYTPELMGSLGAAYAIF